MYGGIKGVRVTVRITNGRMIMEWGANKIREDGGGLCVHDSRGRREERKAALVVKPLLIYFITLCVCAADGRCVRA